MELFVGVFLVLMLTIMCRSIYSRRGTPPGPFSWPIVGCMFSVQQPLHSYFSRLSQKHGPLIYVEVGMLPMVIANSPEMAREVLKTNDLQFANRPPTRYFETYSLGFNGIISASYGEEWKSLRRIALLHMFSPAKLNAIASKRNSVVRSLVTKIFSANGGVVQLREELGELIADNVFAQLVGSKPATSTADSIVQLVEKLTRISLNFNIGEIYPALDRFDLHGIYKNLGSLVTQVTQIIDEIVQASQGADNVIAVLKDHCDSHGLSKNAINVFILDMVGAGIETSLATSEWAMAEVMSHPDVMKKVQEEIDSVVGCSRLVQESDIPEFPYVQAIVKETLRLHPPAPLGLPHYSTKAGTIAGYRIPPKCQIMINIWAIGRDPAHWNDPNKFYPERFLGSDVNVSGNHLELIPFSSGRRVCPGYPLAMRSISLVVATLFHAFNWQRHGSSSLEEATGTITTFLADKLEGKACPRLEKQVYF